MKDFVVEKSVMSLQFAAAINESRASLHGVHVSAHRYEATDGNIMAVVPRAAIDTELEVGASVRFNNGKPRGRKYRLR